VLKSTLAVKVVGGLITVFAVAGGGIALAAQSSSSPTLVGPSANPDDQKGEQAGSHEQGDQNEQGDDCQKNEQGQRSDGGASPTTRPTMHEDSDDADDATQGEQGDDAEQGEQSESGETCTQNHDGDQEDGPATAHSNAPAQGDDHDTYRSGSYGR
jgi:hypothetical protein